MAASTDHKYVGGFASNLKYKIQKARLFVVGTGGIGCELLKNLVLTGFNDLHVVSALEFRCCQIELG